MMIITAMIMAMSILYDVLERIGERRWRLVIPFPKQESKLDILELTR